MIIAHMVVGPNEADRYLAQVLERARTWAHAIFVGLDPSAGAPEENLVASYADAWTWLDVTWEAHEGRFRQAAWEKMEETVRPVETDHVFCLDADEVVHDYPMVEAISREFPGKKIGWTFHEMWDAKHYRVDGHWKPYDAWVMIPYRPFSVFRDRAIASGREPSYASTVPIGPVVGKILHYGYARSEDRIAKYERYMRLDAGKYHNLKHLQSILHTPSTVEWKEGGLLDV